jgi:hypothetical protein
MKKHLLVFLFILCIKILLAHPGIGIVMDSRGNIFYSDLKQVWKLTPDGEKTIAVAAVHTHELAIDENDNLYGEHLWYNGEKLDTWGHYVWRLKNDGALEKVIEPKEGFLENYGFLRDSSGNVYWIERFRVNKFKKKSPDGVISTIAEGKFGDIRWSYCSKAGIIYFVDLHKLYKLTPDGQFTLLATGLDDGKKGFGFSRRHNVYGIWTDVAENIYVAIMPAKKVKRINPDGSIDVVAYSNGAWSPTNGLFDRQGNLWLLEYGEFGNCRARKIEPEKLFPKPNIHKPTIMNYVLIGGAVLILTTLSLLVYKTVKFNNKRRSAVVVA